MTVADYALRTIKTSLVDNQPHLGIMILCILQSDMSNSDKLACASTCARVISHTKFMTLVMRELKSKVGDEILPMPYFNANHSSDVTEYIEIKKEEVLDLINKMEGVSSMKEMLDIDASMKCKIFFLVMQAHWLARHDIKTWNTSKKKK